MSVGIIGRQEQARLFQIGVQDVTLLLFRLGVIPISDQSTELTDRPKPYLWPAHDPDLDTPLWFLPMESQMDSKIWQDDTLDIEIVWWDRSLNTDTEQLEEHNE